VTRTFDIETPHGPARAHVQRADGDRALLVLGHGAGGGITAPDLVAASEAAHAQDIGVALVEQPYRVAGRRSAAPAKQLDAAWLAVIGRVRSDVPLITGGRSLGARVACRTADETGAVAVLCLAFPLEPPRRGDKPVQSRLGELDAVHVPTLVVQGESDPFGMPPPAKNRSVAKVPGNHGLKSDLDGVHEAVRVWLAGLDL
jgi:predicted alpha/beta-hydrolase family hydrolase